MTTTRARSTYRKRPSASQTGVPPKAISSRQTTVRHSLGVGQRAEAPPDLVRMPVV